MIQNLLEPEFKKVWPNILGFNIKGADVVQRYKAYEHELQGRNVIIDRDDTMPELMRSFEDAKRRRSTMKELVGRDDAMKKPDNDAPQPISDTSQTVDDVSQPVAGRPATGVLEPMASDTSQTTNEARYEHMFIIAQVGKRSSTDVRKLLRESGGVEKPALFELVPKTVATYLQQHMDTLWCEPCNQRSTKAARWK